MMDIFLTIFNLAEPVPESFFCGSIQNFGLIAQKLIGKKLRKNK